MRVHVFLCFPPEKPHLVVTSSPFMDNGMDPVPPVSALSKLYGGCAIYLDRQRAWFMAFIVCCGSDNLRHKEICFRGAEARWVLFDLFHICMNLILICPVSPNWFLVQLSLFTHAGGITPGMVMLDRLPLWSKLKISQNNWMDFFNRQFGTQMLYHFDFGDPLSFAVVPSHWHFWFWVKYPSNYWMDSIEFGMVPTECIVMWWSSLILNITISLSYTTQTLWERRQTTNSILNRKVCTARNEGYMISHVFLCQV